MKNKILVGLVTTALVYSVGSYASSSNTDNVNQPHTISQNLQDLKENMKDFAAAKVDQFNQIVSNTYDQLGASLNEINQNLKDKKDKAAQKLQEQADNVSAAIADYKAASVEKQEEMRQNIVDKLESLNESISDYNKKVGS